MIKKILLLFLIFVVLISPVCAEQVTMRVDCKHIIGVGTGTAPINYDDGNNVVYVISEREYSSYGNSYVKQEYPISYTDYCKVKIGDTVTLESPISRMGLFTII